MRSTTCSGPTRTQTGAASRRTASSAASGTCAMGRLQWSAAALERDEGHWRRQRARARRRGEVALDGDEAEARRLLDAERADEDGADRPDRSRDERRAGGVTRGDVDRAALDDDGDGADVGRDQRVVLDA